MKVYEVRVRNAANNFECVSDSAERIHQYLLHRFPNNRFELEEIRNLPPCNSTDITDETFARCYVIVRGQPEEIATPSRITKEYQLNGNCIATIEVTCLRVDSAASPVFEF